MIKKARWRDLSLGCVFALPLILFASFMLVYPLLSTIRLSFFDQRIIGTEAPFVGIDLYRKMLSSPEVFDALKRSLLWTFGNVVVNNTTALLVALLLFQRFRGHSLLESIILIPWVIPNVVSVIIWRYILHPTLGVANYLLVSLGVLNDPLLFLADTTQAMPTIIGVNVWTYFGLRTLIILAALVGISEELFDAAKVDGANAFQRFKHVIWPAIVPVLAVVVLLGGFQTFNNVALVWLFTRGGPGVATTTLPVLIYQKAYLSWRTSEAAVLSVLMALVLMAVAWLYFRLSADEDD